jgi:hypothetical protein
VKKRNVFVAQLAVATGLVVYDETEWKLGVIPSSGTLSQQYLRCGASFRQDRNTRMRG